MREDLLENISHRSVRNQSLEAIAMGVRLPMLDFRDRHIELLKERKLFDVLFPDACISLPYVIKPDVRVFKNYSKWPSICKDTFLKHQADMPFAIEKFSKFMIQNGPFQLCPMLKDVILQRIILLEKAVNEIPDTMGCDDEVKRVVNLVVEEHIEYLADALEAQKRYFRQFDYIYREVSERVHSSHSARRKLLLTKQKEVSSLVKHIMSIRSQLRDVLRTPEEDLGWPIPFASTSNEVVMPDEPFKIQLSLPQIPNYDGSCQCGRRCICLVCGHRTCDPEVAKDHFDSRGHSAMFEEKTGLFWDLLEMRSLKPMGATDKDAQIKLQKLYHQLALTVLDFLAATRTTLLFETSKLIESYRKDISTVAKWQFLIEVDLVLLENKENELLDIYETFAEQFDVIYGRRPDDLNGSIDPARELELNFIDSASNDDERVTPNSCTQVIDASTITQTANVNSMNEGNMVENFEAIEVESITFSRTLGSEPFDNSAPTGARSDDDESVGSSFVRVSSASSQFSVISISQIMDQATINESFFKTISPPERAFSGSDWEDLN